MNPLDRGRAFYECAPGDGGELPWEQLTLVAQEEWVRAALAYEERTQPVVELIAVGRDILVELDGRSVFVTRDSVVGAEMLAQALGAKVVRS